MEFEIQRIDIYAEQQEEIFLDKKLCATEDLFYNR